MKSRLQRFLEWLAGHLPLREIMGDHGDPYLERFFLFRLFGVTAYLHRFIASDPGRELHDHPWLWSVGIVLVGRYFEERVYRSPFILTTVRKVVSAGDINLIRGDDFHRINIDRPCWTLFLHGRRVKGWGFLHRTEAGPFIRPYALQRGEPEAWWQSAPRGRKEKA